MLNMHNIRDIPKVIAVHTKQQVKGIPIANILPTIHATYSIPQAIKQNIKGKKQVKAKQKMLSIKHINPPKKQPVAPNSTLNMQHKKHAIRHNIGIIQQVINFLYRLKNTWSEKM